MKAFVRSALTLGSLDDDSEDITEKLDSLNWKGSLTIELDGLRCQLRSTSTAFMRAAARQLRVPIVHGSPDVILSAVIPSNAPTETSVLSLYEGHRIVVRTLSMETLMRSLLDNLRCRILASASDRVFLKVRTISGKGVGVLIPSLESNDLVHLELAAADAGVTLACTGALALDLKNGRPVNQLRVPGKARSNSVTQSVDAIATQSVRGSLPSKEDVLLELARRTLNLHSVGAKGVQALSALVERTTLIECNERNLFSVLEPLFAAASARRENLSGLAR
ncbi:hypothetical protein BH20ACT23_BH20ACT23_20860 [soil metagenome]